MRDDYREAFKREMYRNLREDFEDSFTPGGYSKKHGAADKPIMIPPSYFRERAPLIAERLARAGIKKPADLNLNDLAEETYIDGAVKYGGDWDMSANPSTPKIPEEMYHPFFEKFFKTEGPRKNPTKPTDEAERKRQFKGATMHLAQLYLKQVMNLAPEDFAFGSKADEDSQRKVVINQYRRYFVGMVTMSLLQLVYAMSGAQVDEFLKIAGIEGVSTGNLKMKKSRDQFSADVVQLMTQLFARQNLGDIILREARRVKQARLT